MCAWPQNLTLVYKERMLQGDLVDRKRLEDLCPECVTLSLAAFLIDEKLLCYPNIDNVALIEV